MLSPIREHKINMYGRNVTVDIHNKLEANITQLSGLKYSKLNLNNVIVDSDSDTFADISLMVAPNVTEIDQQKFDELNS